MLHYADERFQRSADSCVEGSDSDWLWLPSHLHKGVVSVVHTAEVHFCSSYRFVNADACCEVQTLQRVCVCVCLQVMCDYRFLLCSKRVQNNFPREPKKASEHTGEPNLSDSVWKIWHICVTLTVSCC